MTKKKLRKEIKKLKEQIEDWQSLHITHQNEMNDMKQKFQDALSYLRV